MRTCVYAPIHMFTCVYMHEYCNASPKEFYVCICFYARLCKVFTEHFTQELNVNMILSINISQYLCPYATGLFCFRPWQFFIKYPLYAIPCLVNKNTSKIHSVVGFL